MARRGREREPGRGAGVLAAAGAEHQRQLGQGGAARADARPLDTSDKSLPPLRAGMSVEVEVDTGHARGLPHFLTRRCSDLASGQ